MPLFNLTGDNEQDDFFDGLTEKSTRELAHCQGFQFIGSQSTIGLA
jgi:TolB-like protein